MNTEQSLRQQVSDFTDGELEALHVQALLAALNGPAPNAVRQDWDIYHRIGDCLRSEQMASELSAGFSHRFSERLQAEPTVLAPRREKITGRLRGWGVALTAVAAAAMGFALSPSLFHAPAVISPASLASRHTPDTPPVATAMLADAGGAMAQNKEADYILLHQSANPSLYGTLSMSRQAAFTSGAEK